MTTYLLAWNSKLWTWKDLAEKSDAVKEGKVITTRWSCGNNKRIRKGDRVFLIRLGDKPRGIFASGTVVVGSYEDLHWDKEKANSGKTSFFVEVKFDALLDPSKEDILPRDLLNSPPFSEMHWDTQISGIQIPEKITEELGVLWYEFVHKNEFLLPDEVSKEDVLFEGASRQVLVNAYERNPEARRVCIKHYGTACFICGFDFRKTYGEVGKGYIHVHHIQPLSSIGKEYQIDPIRDMRPVCPNCHAIIHRRNPAYSIEEVKSTLKKL